MGWPAQNTNNKTMCIVTIRHVRFPKLNDDAMFYSMTRNHPDLTADHRATIRRTLEAERANLERQISRTLGPVKLDQTVVGRLSRMDALMNQGLAQGSERRAVVELGLIENALDRLDGGIYGICLSCDLPVDVERLMVLPETRDCAACRV